MFLDCIIFINYAGGKMEQSSNLIIYKGDINHSPLTNRQEPALLKNLILWPVQTFRVIAAPLQDLNLFKKSILQLILTGATQVNDIAQLLALDSKFVTYLLEYEIHKYVKKTGRGYRLNNA